MLNNMGLIIEKLIQHMQITLIAVLFAVVVGVPLGIIVSRSEKGGKIILGIANIFQTIPSLALFGFIIPLPLIGGIGYKPAVIVLFLYALLPIIKIFVMGFMYKLTSALLQPVSDKKVADIIDSAGNSLMLLGSCIICVSVMFFIMIAILASAGKVAVGG